MPEGSYFMVGDGRDITRDSRHYGPVPRADILGVATYLWWPLSRFGVLR